MTQKQVDFLRDLQAFIDYCIKNQLSFPLVTSTLLHDLNGMMTSGDAPWFSPKVKGYSKSMADIQTMGADPNVLREPDEED